ncbi:MAG: hypothetical protein EOM70_10040 [Clostridia bacterium]|nr:hypothetical protein [Clostridia bacterium]
MVGTVYHLDRNMAMIWTIDNNWVRVRKQASYSVGDRIQFTAGDIIQGPLVHTSVLSYRQIGAILAGSVLILAIVLYSLQGLLTGFFLPPPVALVTVDINPSVLFAVAENGTVVSAQAQNQDARSLKLHSLPGQPFAAALASVVSQVTDAGIIDPADGVLDYVVVTTVDLGEHDETMANLAGALDQAAIQNRTLSAVNLVLASADETKLDQAKANSIPLGLLALTDMTGLDTTGETVRSFFADPVHVQSLEVKTTGGQLLQIKPKANPSQSALASSGTDTPVTNPAAISLAEPMIDQHNQTPAATKPAAEKKAETPAATSPAAEKKAETPAATNTAATDKKPDNQQAPGQEKKKN